MVSFAHLSFEIKNVNNPNATYLKPFVTAMVRNFLLLSGARKTWVQNISTSVHDNEVFDTLQTLFFHYGVNPVMTSPEATHGQDKAKLFALLRWQAMVWLQDHRQEEIHLA